MRKEQAEMHIIANMQKSDELVGFFQATTPIRIGLYLLIGPLAALSMKQYFVAAGKKGMYFHRLNMWGKFKDYDFFSFTEITSVQFGKGMIQRPVTFQFNNGRSLKLKAQLKGLEKLAKLKEDVQKHIEACIPSAS